MDQALRTKHYGPSTTDQALRTKHYGPSTTDTALADADTNRIDVLAVLAVSGLDSWRTGTILTLSRAGDINLSISLWMLVEVLVQMQ